MFKKHKDAADMRGASRVEGLIHIATMTVNVKGYTLEGIVTDIWRQGCRFRPAATYMVPRDLQTVTIRIADHEITGHVLSSSTTGYRVGFHETLTEEQLSEIIATGVADISAA
jgi:hypothetical protein